MYHILLGRFLRSGLPVVVRYVGQNAIDSEVEFVSKQPLTVGAVLGLVSNPVAAQAGQAEAVATWYSCWVGEDVSAQ